MQGPAMTASGLSGPIATFWIRTVLMVWSWQTGGFLIEHGFCRRGLFQARVTVYEGAIGCSDIVSEVVILFRPCYPKLFKAV